MSAITTGFSSVYGAFNDQDFSYATTLPKKICQRRLLNTQLENVTRYPYRQRLNRAKTTTLNDSRQRWVKLILINHTDTLIKWFLRDDRMLMQQKKTIHWQKCREVVLHGVKIIQWMLFWPNMDWVVRADQLKPEKYWGKLFEIYHKESAGFPWKTVVLWEKMSIHTKFHN